VLTIISLFVSIGTWERIVQEQAKVRTSQGANERTNQPGAKEQKCHKPFTSCWIIFDKCDINYDRNYICSLYAVNVYLPYAKWL